MPPIDIVKAACAELRPLFVSFTASSIYRTQALYVADQNDFYNMVVCGAVREGLTPHDLLAEIHKIEAKDATGKKKYASDLVPSTSISNFSAIWKSTTKRLRSRIRECAKEPLCSFRFSKYSSAEKAKMMKHLF